MTRQVALAERTYERLKRSKAPQESFSEAIERLLDNQPKSPLAFAHRSAALRKTMAGPTFLDAVSRERDADRERA